MRPRLLSRGQDVSRNRAPATPGGNPFNIHDPKSGAAVALLVALLTAATVLVQASSEASPKPVPRSFLAECPVSTLWRTSRPLSSREVARLPCSQARSSLVCSGTSGAAISLPRRLQNAAPSSPSTPSLARSEATSSAGGFWPEIELLAVYATISWFSNATKTAQPWTPPDERSSKAKK